MAVNGIMSLKMAEVQKKHPKGKAVESDVASAYKSLEKELKSKYPYVPKAESMQYGSKGKAYGA